MEHEQPRRRMMENWYNKFITVNRVTRYTAWDETQENELGTFDSYEEAKEALLDYAKTLEPKENS
jgi:hypothetical protein